jgi:DNA-binding CsgD family transcriptional regulator
VILLVNKLRHPGGSAAVQRRDHKLTESESRVAQIAALGVSNLEISRTLELSLNTVKTHLRRIYQKLNVHRQGELVALLGSGPPRGDAD